jgi:hypothetical protein
MPDKPKTDLEWLAAFLDTATTSDQPGEAENAVRAAVKLMRKTKLRAVDFVQAMAERDRALEVLAKYEARLTVLEAEIKRLRANNHGPATGTLPAALWHDAGTISAVTSRSAEWVLDLIAQGRLHLKTKDVDFVQSCARWSRPLTTGQEAWLLDIVRRVAKHTGMSPP